MLERKKYERQKIKSTVKLESDNGLNNFSVITNIENNYCWTELLIDTEYTTVEHRLVIMSDLKRIRDTIDKHISYLEENDISKNDPYGINGSFGKNNYKLEIGIME